MGALGLGLKKGIAKIADLELRQSVKEERKKTRSVAIRVYDAFLTLGLVGVAVLVGIILLISLVYFMDYLDDRHDKEFRSCSCARTMALNIQTSIASYYADPANQEVPTIAGLMKEGHLYLEALECGSFKHRATIEEISATSGNYTDIKITVFLDEDCDYPLGNKFIKYMIPRDEAGVSQFEPEGWN
jgi:hypothetical protein